jgi:hypothetical protein
MLDNTIKLWEDESQMCITHHTVSSSSVYTTRDVINSGGKVR